MEMAIRPPSFATVTGKKKGLVWSLTQAITLFVAAVHVVVVVDVIVVVCTLYC